MESREMSLIEDLDSLLKGGVLNQDVHNRLSRKAIEKSIQLEETIAALHEENAKCAVLEHDNRIQEQIILQLTYEKYKKVIDK